MKFEFIADRPCLDFVPTVAERGTTDEEKLATPADLVAWAAQSCLVDDLDRVSDAELVHAQQVRDAIFRLITALINHTAAVSCDRELVNAAAANPRPRLLLTTDGQIRHEGGLSALLSALATDCLDLHDHSDRTRLHWCADTRCTRPFIDRSHSQRRRWCGMKGCGDRAKAATYRRRRNQAAHRP